MSKMSLKLSSSEINMDNLNFVRISRKIFRLFLPGDPKLILLVAESSISFIWGKKIENRPRENSYDDIYLLQARWEIRAFGGFSSSFSDIKSLK